MAEPVSISGVAKTFVTGDAVIEALAPIDLHIDAREFVAIVGPSGCGKSTLLRLIAGLDQPTAGALAIGGTPVRRTDPRCAIMFQEPRLFPWKRIDQNVAVGRHRRSAAPGTPEDWLERVGLAGFARARPHELSGGMAQRAALARALIGEPQVLLLDEPFGALDALTRLQMQRLLAQVCADVGTTVIMVTHDIDEALTLADRVVVMCPRPGRIVDLIDLPGTRPRDRQDASLQVVRHRILRKLGLAANCTGSAAALMAVAAD